LVVPGPVCVGVVCVVGEGGGVSDHGYFFVFWFWVKLEDDYFFWFFAFFCYDVESHAAVALAWA
jgi:hypothetical protein